MRFLLSFILTSLFFIPSQGRNATTIPGKELAKAIQHNLSETDVAGYSEIGSETITIFHNNNIRNSSNQQRFFQSVLPNHSNLYVTPVEILLHAHRIEDKYSYCIPIGQKLLFPKHYFW